jgi:hypothetical protein
MLEHIMAQNIMLTDLHTDLYMTDISYSFLLTDPQEIQENCEEEKGEKKRYSSHAP